MPITQRPGRTVGALAALPLLVGLLVGCSAAGGASSPAPSGASELTDQQEYDAWTLKINACMKEQGYELPPPGDTSGKGVEIEGDVKVFEAAMTACQDTIGPGPGGTPSRQQSDDMQQGMLQMFQCLRDKGYDVEDPAPGGAVTLPSGVAPEDLTSCQAETGGGGPSVG